MDAARTIGHGATTIAESNQTVDIVSDSYRRVQEWQPLVDQMKKQAEEDERRARALEAYLQRLRGGN